MKSHRQAEINITRDFTATAFVYWQGKTLLHRHKKLGLWLPCGGHVDPHELPDDAAKREVLEESGVEIELVGERALDIHSPRQLIRPRGIQLEFIHDGHEHIDLIYFARPAPGYNGYLLQDDPSLGWYSPNDLKEMDITQEIKAWTKLLFEELEVL
jgi:8-oxo-dGTP pyrophosphatase MutT (NUDIX family)